MTLRHIVMFKMNAETEHERDAQAARLVAALEALPPNIQQIRALSVGVNTVHRPGNWDVVLTVDVDDEAALELYRNHPDHVTVMQLVAQTVAERCAVDFRVEAA